MVQYILLDGILLLFSYLFIYLFVYFFCAFICFWSISLLIHHFNMVWTMKMTHKLVCRVKTAMPSDWGLTGTFLPKAAVWEGCRRNRGFGHGAGSLPTVSIPKRLFSLVHCWSIGSNQQSPVPRAEDICSRCKEVSSCHFAFLCLAAERSGVLSHLVLVD